MLKFQSDYNITIKQFEDFMAQSQILWDDGFLT